MNAWSTLKRENWLFCLQFLLRSVFIAQKHFNISWTFVPWKLGKLQKEHMQIVPILIKHYLCKLPSGKLARFKELLLCPDHHECFGIMMQPRNINLLMWVPVALAKCFLASQYLK